MAWRETKKTGTENNARDRYDDIKPSATWENFKMPLGVTASGKEGKVFVVDKGNNVVKLLDMNGSVCDSFGSKGKGQGQFQSPQDVTVLPSGYLAVTDALNERVQLFDDEFKFVKDVGGEQGTGSAEFNWPCGIVNKNGVIYVADRYNNRIQAFTQELDLIFEFGNEGTEQECFSEPTLLAVNSNDEIIISDSSNKRLQVFSLDGEHQNTIRYFAEGAAEPVGIAIDDNDNILVCERDKNCVHVLAPNFTRICKFGNNLKNPSGIAVREDGKVLVADYCADKVYVF